MKYFVAGQKKESIFNIRKNRIMLFAIGAVLIAIPSLIYYDYKEAIMQVLTGGLIFAVIEFIMSKLPKKDFLTVLEITDDIINVGNRFAKNNQSVSISAIKEIEKSLTEIRIVSKEADEINIPFSLFSYNDVQSIKAEIDRVRDKVEVSKNIPLVSLEY